VIGAPRLLDLFCCEGGAARGYQLAGWHVTGVDITDQPRYCGDEFHQGDALRFLTERGHEFDAIHASPPCQAYSDAQVLQGREHPRLITPTRDLCLVAGVPYVVENVGGARRELRDPVMLCGLMFGLQTDRHRWFESSVPLAPPAHPVGPRGRSDHSDMPKTKMGRPFVAGELRQYVGNFHGPAAAREDLGVPWMSRDGIRECVPPAYTRLIGEQLLTHIASKRAA
jgi:DNA (cytosine-5)-methyltransferase 1